MSLLQPGEHFEGLEVVSNPRFAARTNPKRASREAELFAKVVYAATRAHEAGMAVTVDSVRQFNRQLPKKLVQEVLGTEKFARAAEQRGIRLSGDPDLSAEQLAALAIYMDTSAAASHSMKLKAMGVTDAKWRGWMKQPAFAQRLSDVAGSLLREAIPVAMQRISEGVDKGDKWAIEMSMEITGVHDRRGDTSDTRRILMDVFTVLDEMVDDPAILTAIGEKVRARMGQSAPQMLVAQPTPSEE